MEPLSLSPGSLDRWITIRTAAPTQSTSGEPGFDWDGATDEVVAAHWLAAGTRESWQAQQRLGSYIDGVYRIYYRDAPSPDNTRILGHTGQLFDLKPPVEVGHRVGLDLPVVGHGEV